MRNNNHLDNLNKRRLIHNDNKKSLPNKSEKNLNNQNKNFERNLIILKEGLTDYSNKYKKKIGPFYNNKDEPIKNLSFSATRYHNLKSTYEKKDLSLILNKKNLNLKPIISSKAKSLYLTTINDYSSFDNNKRPNKRYKLRSPIHTNAKSENHYLDKSYNISDISKTKEIIMLNKIFKKQIKQFKIKTEEMRNKINELVNNLKLVRMDNQKLNKEKKKLLMNISYLENELEINKNKYLNQLELKDNNIGHLKDDIMKFNLNIEEKENEIINLRNQINNLNNNVNNYNIINNDNYNNNYTNKFYNNYIDDNINELDVNIKENNVSETNNKNNIIMNNKRIEDNSNKNDLLNQINILKNQNKENIKNIYQK